ncbi:MAG: response regulator transcription factor [Chitinophagales bacterium]|nr:response regulator transcription factor [Chitinophagales bacterium]
MISITLCDDHQIVRKGIRQILEERPDFKVVSEVSNGEQLLKELRLTKPNVVLLDIGLPGRSGLEVLKQIHLLYPRIKVLVLSMYPEDQYAIRTIKAGASGYLHKDSAPNVLYEAITTIASGGKYVSAAITNLLFNEILSESKGSPLHKTLSDREFEVLLQLGKGKKVGEIAQGLTLSVKTVSTYKTRIFEKLGIDNVAEITQYLLKHNLLQENLAEEPH